MWIYYYCMHGPGHQSSDYGFEYFHSNFTKKDIKDHILHRYECWDDPVIRFWEIENPIDRHVNRRIERTKEKIEGLKEYLKVLENITPFSPKEEIGKDDTIQRNLKGKIDHDLLRRLHKAGFMYSANDISNWKYGTCYPVEPDRSKILRIIRRSESYKR